MTFSISFNLELRKPGPLFQWQSLIPFLLMFPFLYLARKLLLHIFNEAGRMGLKHECNDDFEDTIGKVENAKIHIKEKMRRKVGLNC